MLLIREGSDNFNMVIPAEKISCTLTFSYHTHTHTHVRPLGFCHRWSVRLEQSPGPCPQSELHRSCFQAPAKDISVRAVYTSAPSALCGWRRTTYKSTQWNWSVWCADLLNLSLDGVTIVTIVETINGRPGPRMAVCRTPKSVGAGLAYGL